MTMDQQAALERQRALYREKNAHLRQYLEPVDPFEFYREIFPEGSFERKGHYEDAKGNAIALTVPKKQNSRENGVALEIEGDGRARRHLITDELQELGDDIFPVYLQCKITVRTCYLVHHHVNNRLGETYRISRHGHEMCIRDRV